MSEKNYCLSLLIIFHKCMQLFVLPHEMAMAKNEALGHAAQLAQSPWRNFETLKTTERLTRSCGTYPLTQLCGED